METKLEIDRPYTCCVLLISVGGLGTDAEIITEDDIPMGHEQTINQNEISHSHITSNSEAIIEETSNLSPHHVSHTEYKTIWDAAEYSIEVHDRIPPEEMVCCLGKIKLSISGYRSFKDSEKASDVALPRFLPEGKFSFFVGASADTIFIIYDVPDGNQENIIFCGSNSKARSYLCLRGSYIPTSHPSQFDALEYVCRIKKGKLVKLLLDDYKKCDAMLTVSVCLLQGALFTPQFAAQPTLGRTPQVENMTKLMNWMDGFTIPGTDLQTQCM